jgi:hypothetical protein
MVHPSERLAGMAGKGAAKRRRDEMLDYRFRRRHPAGENRGGVRRGM